VIIFELVGTESDPNYQTLAIENLDRQYRFVESVYHACVGLNRIMLSGEVIRALNYHAIACLHVSAGQWRPCAVRTTREDGTEHLYPDFYRVPALMDAFIDEVNRGWEQADPLALAAFVLWRLNYIHPFINGNGRTARVACHLVLCLKIGFYIGGEHILSELIRTERSTYVKALRTLDKSYEAGAFDLKPMHDFLVALLQKIEPEAAPDEPASV